MSKNNFKNEIRERYKGRGNVWVRVNPTETVFQDLMEKVKNEDSSEFLTHVEREGFAWMRFIKPLGNASSPTCLFEVRFRGSKIDHPDCTLELPDDAVKHLPLLGNTPFKLQLETHPSDRVSKKENQSAVSQVRKKKRKNISLEEEINLNVLEDKILTLKEAPLTDPTQYELREWEDFLRSEGLLEGQ